MEQTNAVNPRTAEETAGKVITWREIQVIVRKTNAAEGRSQQNYHPRARMGKTHNEYARGEMKRREANKEERAMWGKDPSRTGANHPRHTCNGHRYYRGTQVKTMPAMNHKNIRRP